MFLTIARPIPIPPVFVVKFGENIFPFMSSGIPFPLSWI